MILERQLPVSVFLTYGFIIMELGSKDIQYRLWGSGHFRPFNKIKAFQDTGIVFMSIIQTEDS